MRLTELLVIAVAGILFLVVTPNFKRPSPYERQAQEEAPIETINSEGTFAVSYKVKSFQEESIADILWMKKAAKIAQDNGVPYFNVVEQNVSKRWDEKRNREVTVIEGIIQLDPDPMRAEFDALEINSLVLTDQPQ